MKILVQILFIALVVFPYPVELIPPGKVPNEIDKQKAPARYSSPRRLPGQLYEPDSPPSTSYNRYSSPPSSPRRKQQDKVPKIPSSTPNVDKLIDALKKIDLAPKDRPGKTLQQPGTTEISIGRNTVEVHVAPQKPAIEDIFYEDDRGIHPLLDTDKIQLLVNDENLVGWDNNGTIAPLFNGKHQIIRVARDFNNQAIVMDEDEARKWGVFQLCEEFMKRMNRAGFSKKLKDLKSRRRRT